MTLKVFQPHNFQMFTFKAEFDYHWNCSKIHIKFYDKKADCPVCFKRNYQFVPDRIDHKQCSSFFLHLFQEFRSCLTKSKIVKTKT